MQTHAQDNVVAQEDSSVFIENSINEVEPANDKETIRDNGSFGEEVLGDTLIGYYDFKMNPDSVLRWKNSVKYAWIKRLDSILKAKEKQTKSQTREVVRQEESIKSGVSATERFFNSGFLKGFLWILAGCFVVFVIFKLFLSKAAFGTGGKKAVITVVEEVEDQNMDNDFHQLYKKAYAAGDMRLAMRYLFLKTLQSLNDKELIRFAVDKTNSMYVAELPQAKRNDFASLALYYEYIWYGNFVIQPSTFDTIETKYNDFLQKI